ncbi:hypothetical protein IAG25_31185 [Caballeronia sp. EK]|uniref:hypothetical protein n=1 Tax=Caballeronia sp. EK TaxID=2767469 RepID=UPI001655174A|nr:hypothetical protein [Caballeronia sp. EK]MBC8641288.1 hypothetical protein [Caballeronia sp. EK]
MGYKVKISYSGDAQRLCDLLSESPAEVFDKPFFGYLLFLLTGNEKQLISELSRQFGEFESLSRDTFAYVLVANEASIPIDNVQWEPAAYEDYASKSALAVQCEKDRLSYIKARGIASYGSAFTKSDRGELLAMSDAVNEIARWFGATPKLPCILVFDAIPHKDPTIVPLDQFAVDNLIKLFRNVVGKVSGPHYREQIKIIQRIGQLNQAIDETYVPQEPTIEGIRSEELAKIKFYSESFSALSRCLLGGSAKGETLQCLSALELPSAVKECVRVSIARTHGHRKKLSDALWNVDRCAASLGTDAELEIKPKRVFRRSIAPLLPAEHTLQPPNTADEWQQLKLSLQQQLRLEVDTVLYTVPPVQEIEKELDERVRAEFTTRSRFREERLSRAISQKEERDSLMREFVSFSFPSFSAILQDELKNAGMAYSIGNMQASALNWITKPATVEWLSKLFDLARRATGL